VVIVVVAVAAAVVGVVAEVETGVSRLGHRKRSGGKRFAGAVAGAAIVNAIAHAIEAAAVVVDASFFFTASGAGAGIQEGD